MSYILNKTSGTILTTVQDSTIDDTTTSLTFIGRNFAGYGRPLEENLVGLLENFNNKTAPTSPIQGQTWFNYGTQQLNVCYDGSNFKGIASLNIVGSRPATGQVTGNMVWSTASHQLSIYDEYNGGWTTIGPFNQGLGSNWIFTKELTDQSVRQSTILGQVDGLNVLVISDINYTPAPYSTSDIGPGVGQVNTFTVVKAGITLPNADPITGVSAVSTTSGYMLWGTAAHSLSSSGLSVSTAPSGTFYIPMVSASSGVSQAVVNTSFNYNNGVLNATATSAYYADLAERYEADAVYEVGTVLVIGGLKEVTTTTKFADTRVVGIVSKKPAYLMNKDAGNDETHPPIALKGRVPCKVHGYIERGDLLVTSDYAGYATAAKSVSEGAVIAKALQSNSQGFGVIEVLVV